MTLNPRASAKQLEASDPRSSAWVNANAGSGKTHVLVDRVIRLLLTGTEPSRIMCLTFTKAAASEMSNRLFERLSAWVPLDDAALDGALALLGIAEPKDSLRLRARQLFTRALETPGGLKIQTIHAFCERLLQLFPVEAGIVPRFTVMDERSAVEMLQQARDATLAAAIEAPHGALGLAVADVVAHVQADQFEELMRQLLGQRANLGGVLESQVTIAAATILLRRQLDLGVDETASDVIASATLDRAVYPKLAEALARGGKTDRERGELIARVLGDPAASLADLASLYLTTKNEGKALSSMATKPVIQAHGWIEPFLLAEQQRLAMVLGKLADLRRIAATASLLTVGAAILSAFEAAKRRAGAYDFEDLIIRTGELLSERPEAAWVLYKLDGGIEHLLVDEAQDTSPAQWSIVTALTEEFFAGAGSRGSLDRTVFAVGDRKQSIFSFQGADPDIFEVVHDQFAARAGAAGQQFADVDLTVSFRSTKAVLAVVDAVFDPRSPARKGLDGHLARDWLHESNRGDQPGLVELWPLVEPEEGDERDHWMAPVDREPARSPSRRLARKLAQTIRSWIGRRVIDATNTLVKPEDILVLVRARNVFFDALIRELRQAGVPVAGADRLKLIDNIAVLDLLALARFCLMPEDDHALACVLKSPVLATPLTEDQLMALAIGRGPRSLWEVLRDSPEPWSAAAAARLGAWAASAASARAFEFFSGVLNQSRLAFLSRLGSEANDALDALLDSALGYEESRGAGLAGFINWFEAGEVEIKRNMEQGAGEVRIMTVHGAKGLEAPIVILPDTASLPTGRSEPPLMMVEVGNGGARIPLWPLSKLFVSEALADLKARMRDGQADEYRRLLYVALTRARDELYVCGYRGKTRPGAGCWYELVEQGLNRVVPQPHVFADDGSRRLGPDPMFRDEPETETLAASGPPSWLDRPPAEDAPGGMPATVSALAGRQAIPHALQQRAGRGILIHKILQQLPVTPLDQRRAMAGRMVRKAAFDQALADSIIAMTEAPDLSFIFAVDGLSEIPLVAELPELGLTVTGRIDRLLVTPETVVAVDYKTTPAPPSNPEGVEASDLAQLALYRMALRRVHPGAEIRMALLFTAVPRLMFLPDPLLDRALDHMAVKRP